MNAIMPGHSPPQFQTFGASLAPIGDDALPHYAHAGTNTISNAVNESPILGHPEDRINNNDSSEMPVGPNHQRQPSSSTTATPQENIDQQQAQKQPLTPPRESQISQGTPSPSNGYGGSAGTPFGLGVPSQPIRDPILHNSAMASYPWSIGSTDGSFAIVNLQQQQQQIQIQHQQEELQRRALAAHNNSSNSIGEDSGQSLNGVSSGSTPRGDASTGSGEASGPSGGVAVGPHPSGAASPVVAMQQAIAQSAAVIRAGRSLYHDRLFHQSSSSVESVLAATCDVMGFDIAEMWLRTGFKTHQLTNSHLRPTALQDSVRQDLVEVYYGDKSNERTHRLSPALCKRAKDANDVVWVTAQTPNGAEALRMSINNVRTAVAVPVCHEASNTNVTIIYFSIRRIVLRPAAVEFLIHMSLSAAVTSVNALAMEGLIDRPDRETDAGRLNQNASDQTSDGAYKNPHALSKSTDGRRSKSDIHAQRPSSSVISYRRPGKTSVTGAPLDLQWRQLLNVEYLTDGGNSWIHTAIFDGKPVVVKTLRPECQDVAIAINEIESEVAVHSQIDHPNIVNLVGAGWTSKKARFIVLERLDGGTLTQMLGYDTRIRDRRRRFWRKKQLPYLDVLRCARSLACAMQYCHEQAIPGSMVLHRDLKPDNIGFTLDGKVKLIDFGLARTLENSDYKSNDVYEMSGETGSLRYMSPEVAEGLPYNHKADVYSFGVILWEMNAGKRPFNGLSRDSFYEQVVHGGSRPHLSKKWPTELNKLIAECWNVDIESRPTFGQIVDRIDDLLTNEKGGKSSTPKVGGKAMQKVSRIIDRHSSWF